jgi:hypothetical protein
MQRSALLLAVVLGAAPFFAHAQDELVYREGPVMELSYIKIRPGKFDDYMAFLAGPYRQLMDAEKKAGNIVDWGIWGARAGSPKEADLILTTTYANMAALDGLEERSVPQVKQVWGSRQKSNAAFADRESMREILGSELVRELILK